MNDQFTPELLAKACTAETPESLLALAAEGGVTLTPEEAKAHFDQLHQTGELSDEELDNVAGGCGGSSEPQYTPEGYWKNYKECEHFVCDECGHMGTPATVNKNHTCRNNWKVSNSCNKCHYLAGTTGTMQKGGYCTHPANRRPA